MNSKSLRMKKLIFKFLVMLSLVLLPSLIFAESAVAPTTPSGTTTISSDLQQRMTLLKKLMETQTKSSQQTTTQPNQPMSQTAQIVQNIQATNQAQLANQQLMAPQQPAALPDNAALLPPPPLPTTGQSPPVPTLTMPKPIPSTNSMYEEAFSGVVNQMLPMSPEQISRLRLIFNETQRAAATPPGVPPRPATTSVLVNLSPQATPPVIRLGAGYITSLVFIDSTGQPWPIAAYSIGDPTAFNIQWDKTGNTLLIQAASYYKRSNLAVILKNLNTPVMLTLLSGQEAVDYRVDLRVPGMGPNAMLIQSGLPESANPVLLDVLNGIPPKGSKTLRVTGGDCQAWLLGNKLFLRTTLDVISPAWKSVMSSIDGTHAYELQPAPVILALQRGKDKTLILSIEGFE